MNTSTQKSTIKQSKIPLVVEVWGNLSLLSIIFMIYYATKIVMIPLNHPNLFNSPNTDISAEELNVLAWMAVLLINWMTLKLFFSIRICPEVLGYALVPRTWWRPDTSEHCN